MFSHFELFLDSVVGSVHVGRFPSSNTLRSAKTLFASGNGRDDRPRSSRVFVLSSSSTSFVEEKRSSYGFSLSVTHHTNQQISSKIEDDLAWLPVVRRMN